MNRAEALAALQGPDVDIRLTAARVLSMTATHDDASMLREAIAKEQDRWVRHHLTRAIRFAADRRTNRRRLVLATSREQQDELLGVAIAEVTGLLLHEVNVLVGDIRRHAEREVPDYLATRTREAIDRLDRLTDAIGDLNRAASPAKVAEFDLGAMVERLADACSTRSGYPVEISGRSPALVLSDEGLVELVVDQGIRNAIEASRSGKQTNPVAVAWSVEPDKFTVSVLDRGIGLPKGFDRTLRTVRTTKDKRTNRGLGLMTGSRAARSVGGSIVIAPRSGGGTAFIFVAPNGRPT